MLKYCMRKVWALFIALLQRYKVGLLPEHVWRKHVLKVGPKTTPYTVQPSVYELTSCIVYEGWLGGGYVLSTRYLHQ